MMDAKMQAKFIEKCKEDFKSSHWSGNIPHGSFLEVVDNIDDIPEMYRAPIMTAYNAITELRQMALSHPFDIDDKMAYIYNTVYHGLGLPRKWHVWVEQHERPLLFCLCHVVPFGSNIDQHYEEIEKDFRRRSDIKPAKEIKLFNLSDTKAKLTADYMKQHPKYGYCRCFEYEEVVD